MLWAERLLAEAHTVLQVATRHMSKPVIQSLDRTKTQMVKLGFLL